ncbi:MAG: hypothetical protein COB38_12825 [Gammaproteobacteria bacterium]|nr:MAG: hypothetical protein COB38_12825 [Gammaproteobacteria bacterium]
MNAISLKEMTTAEKISTMEVLWNDLCENNSIDSPVWHESVLANRERLRSSGVQEPIGWEAAKQQLRNKI